MTEAAQPDSAQTEARAFAEIWASSMAAVLGEIAGKPFPVESSDSAPPEAVPPAETDLNIVVTAGGALRGEMSLRLPQACALAAAQVLMGESQDPAAELNTESKEAAEELLRQVMGHVVTAVKGRWGEAQLRLESGPAPTWAAGTEGWFASGAEAPARIWMEWQMSAALCAELRPEKAQPESPHQSVTGSANLPPGEIPQGQVVPGKLDLFMDVELEITLRFGGRRMLLREVLELGPGAVVELDRQVQDPVDLVLDGKLIARGEVVVVDGNYGLRILDVVTGQLPGQMHQA
jgi:flagellar motor switch protein FliN